MLMPTKGQRQMRPLITLLALSLCSLSLPAQASSAEAASMSSQQQQSPDELKAEYEKLLATMPPEVQKIFRENEEKAKNQPPRPRLAEISSASLKSLAGEDLDLAVYDYVETRLSGANDRKLALLSLPRGLQIFYLSFVIEAEVMNGGFNQFFWNSSAEMAELVAPALRDLQANEAARIFDEALAVAHSEVAATAKFKSKGTLDAFSKSYAETNLTKFDTSFCNWAEKFPLLRANLLRDHEEIFLTRLR
jgi:hypothetical protein